MEWKRKLLVTHRHTNTRTCACTCMWSTQVLATAHHSCLYMWLNRQRLFRQWNDLNMHELSVQIDRTRIERCIGQVRSRTSFVCLEKLNATDHPIISAVPGTNFCIYIHLADWLHPYTARARRLGHVSINQYASCVNAQYVVVLINRMHVRIHACMGHASQHDVYPSYYYLSYLASPTMPRSNN